MDKGQTRRLIRSAVGPHSKFCTGYSGHGSYVTALSMAIASFPKTFTHAGSDVLDSILAFDRAEAEDTYLGQINMIAASSFCGPEGLIWGYDCARTDYEELHSGIQARDLELSGSVVRCASGLRDAARLLFGAKTTPHFPFLPGSHVLCAGRYRVFQGPTNVYTAVAIGIPKDRRRWACVFMEDVGEIAAEDAVGGGERLTYDLMMKMARSVALVGVNQGVAYREILADCIMKGVPPGHFGCGLVLIPYFHLARDAYDRRLAYQGLHEWVRRKQGLFLHT